MAFSLLAPRVKADVANTCNGVDQLSYRSVGSLIQELLDSRFAISPELIEEYTKVKEIEPSYPTEQFYAEFQKQYSDVLKLAYLNGYSKKVSWLAQVILNELAFRGSLNLRFHDLLKDLVTNLSLYAEIYENTNTTVNQNAKLLALRSAVIYRHNTFINSHRQKYTGEFDGNVIVPIAEVYSMLNSIPMQCAYGRDDIKDLRRYDSTMNKLRNQLLLLDIVNRCIVRGERGYEAPELEHLRAFANNLFNSQSRMRNLSEKLKYGDSNDCCCPSACSDYSQVSDTKDIDPAVIIMADNVYDLAMYGINRYKLDRPGVQSALKWTAVAREAIRARMRTEEL